MEDAKLIPFPHMNQLPASSYIDDPVIFAEVVEDFARKMGHTQPEGSVGHTAMSAAVDQMVGQSKASVVDLADYRRVDDNGPQSA